MIALGLFLLIGFAAHVVGQRAHVPRVSLLLVIGVVSGPHALGLVPQSITDWFPMVAEVALSMVGFMMGERFIGKQLRATGRVVLTVAAAETLGVAVAVFFGLVLFGAPLQLALLMAGIASATDPAATADVIRESGATGPLTDTVLGVVAVDDAFGIILFSILLAVAQSLSGTGFSGADLSHAAWEVFGGVALGGSLGVVMAWVSGRAQPGELTLLEAAGFVLLGGGLASALGVSYLLAAIALGATVANRAKHHERPFHAIEGISQPFLIVFFLLAGFEFDPSGLATFGLIGGVYVVGRTAGKLVGCRLGTRSKATPPVVRKYVGWCLLPQAGVALGLGLVAAQRFPEYGPRLLSVLVATTFVFEVFGPISTRIALKRAGETAGPGLGRKHESGDQDVDFEHPVPR